MFYVGQRVICDRMGINRQWTDHESGRLEIETYYDVENGVDLRSRGFLPPRGIEPAAGIHGFPQRGGIYTVAGITPGKITLKEIHYLYWEDNKESEPQWWDQALFRPFNNSNKRDLKWFEVLERIREMNHNVGLTATRLPGTDMIVRAGYAAKIYVVAFQNFLDVDWGTSEDWPRSWTAQDVFDAVNVVLCQDEYDYHALEHEQLEREHGGSPPDDNPPGGSPSDGGPPSGRKDPPSGVVQLRSRRLISAKPSAPSESALSPGLRSAT